MRSFFVKKYSHSIDVEKMFFETFDRTKILSINKFERRIEMKRLIVFVCGGNIHRSVVAEQYLKQLIKGTVYEKVSEIISRGIQGSAGTQSPKHQNITEYAMEWSITKPILENLGVEVSGFYNHQAKPITKDVMEKAWVVFPMDRKTFNDSSASVLGQFPEYSNKVKLFTEISDDKADIPDCFDSSDEELYYVANKRIIQIAEEVFSMLKEKYEEEGMIDIKHILKDHAYQNAPLSYDEAYALGIQTLESCNEGADKTIQIQSISALCALHTKATYRWKWNRKDARVHEHELPRSAAEQIAGICVAVFEYDIAKSRYGYLCPKVSYVIDNCGMGGDLIVTANVSTIAAFIASAAGVVMCKHGSPANADKGRHGSSDFIAQICGIDNYASREAVEKCVEKHGFGYTEACDTGYKKIHMQTHEIAQLPHMNDIIGPITNPVDPKIATKKILGMNHLISPRIAAEVYQILNQKEITNLEHGLFVRGFVTKDRYEGIDEVSVCEGGTQVAELRNGEIIKYDLYASDFGIEPVSIEEITPIGSKGEYSMKILKGEVNGSRVKIVLANAALLLKLAGVSEDLKKCYKIAEEIFQSGKAYEKMLAVRHEVPLL
ncbi:MAG: hypothetical protein V1804_01900 [Patescibacteria group bacterium]